MIIIIRVRFKGQIEANWLLSDWIHSVETFGFCLSCFMDEASSSFRLKASTSRSRPSSVSASFSPEEARVKTNSWSFSANSLFFFAFFYFLFVFFPLERIFSFIGSEALFVGLSFPLFSPSISLQRVSVSYSQSFGFPFSCTFLFSFFPKRVL